MKTGLQMGLICLMLMAGGCGQKAEKESKSEPANPPEKTRQTSEIIQIAEETEPKPLPERTSKPVFFPGYLQYNPMANSLCKGIRYAELGPGNERHMD